MTIKNCVLGSVFSLLNVGVFLNTLSLALIWLSLKTWAKVRKA